MELEIINQNEKELATEQMALMDIQVSMTKKNIHET